MNECDKALAFATKAHEGQKRKGGDPYITHPIAVSELAGKLAATYAAAYASFLEGTHLEHFILTTKKSALLHDVVEDTDFTVEDIEKEFGPEIAHIVDVLTKREGENYCDFLKRVVYSSSIAAKIVKMSDNIHNLSTWKKDGSLADKWRLSLWILEMDLRLEEY